MNILINNTIFLGGIIFYTKYIKIQNNFKINVEILINVYYNINIKINKGDVKMIKLNLDQLKIASELFPNLTILEFVELVKKINNK